jgi:hypothetical protein
VSDDLTRGVPGRVLDNGHTLTTLAESPVQAGVLWAGSDDGLVHVSRDAGKTWKEVGRNVPETPLERWVTRIECSRTAAGTAYLALDRHRQDDRAPYLFKTEDYGTTWRPMRKGLPDEGYVHVVRVDPRNPELLYCGTENGLYVTVDGGRAWQRLRAGMPTVPVHDVVVQPRERELVVATHGRGIYIIDAGPLQEMTAKALAAPVYLCEVKNVESERMRFTHGLRPGKNFLAANPFAGATCYYTAPGGSSEPLRFAVVDAAGREVAVLQGGADRGLHRLEWDLSVGKETAAAGEYQVRLKGMGDAPSRRFRILAEE